jgi:hypothetical protein
MTSKFKLCYVDDNFAWFTTAPLDKQWGDDWNDAPYEHNAGAPYEWAEHRDMPEYKLTKLAFYHEYAETPADIAGCNSRYSVQAINSGAIAWLAINRYGKDVRAIHAGCTPEEFTNIIKETGGEVFAPV